MNVKWLWLDHFPAGLETTAQQRLEARKRARQHRRREPNFAGANRRARRILLAWVPALAIIFVVWCFRPLWLSWKPSGLADGMLWGLSPVVLNAVCWTVIAYAINRSNAPFVRR